MPPTCFVTHLPEDGHTCGHPQGGALQRMYYTSFCTIAQV